jgi:hypothetical protein
MTKTKKETQEPSAQALPPVKTLWDYACDRTPFPQLPEETREEVTAWEGQDARRQSFFEVAVETAFGDALSVLVEASQGATRSLVVDGCVTEVDDWSTRVQAASKLVDVRLKIFSQRVAKPLKVQVVDEASDDGFTF